MMIVMVVMMMVDTIYTHTTRYTHHLSRASSQHPTSTSDPHLTFPHKVVGALIIPILKDGDKRHLILISEYRQAVHGRVISFPGGGTDPGESPEETARREFKEETGYTLSRIIKSYDYPLVGYLSPWHNDDASATFIAEIDADSPDGQNPVQSLDLGEEINVVILRNLGPDSMQDYMKMCKDNNSQPTTEVIVFLLGLSYSRNILNN